MHQQNTINEVINIRYVHNKLIMKIKCRELNKNYVFVFISINYNLT